MTWTASVRLHTLQLADPIQFETLELDENFNTPDRLVIDGALDDIRVALQAGRGVLLHDDAGVQRFSGIAVDIERRGDGTGAVTYASDLQWLWDRICWPSPTAAWTAQTASHDVQTAPAETRALGYIARNAGPSAYASGGDDRRVDRLRLPTSAGRGPTAKSTARFQNVGQLAGRLCEAAGLRLRVVQTYEPSGARWLDVVLDEVPDLSAWAQFGPAESASPALLDEEWRYRVAPGVSVVLCAAGGEGAARALTQSRDAAREGAWGGRRVEMFLDQRGADDAGEIAEARADALAENDGDVEGVAPLADSGLLIGTEVPVGAKVAALLDGVLVTERIRRITTKIPGEDGEDMTVTPVLGSPDGLAPPEQRALTNALRRLSKLERST